MVEFYWGGLLPTWLPCIVFLLLPVMGKIVIPSCTILSASPFSRNFLVTRVKQFPVSIVTRNFLFPKLRQTVYPFTINVLFAQLRVAALNSAQSGSMGGINAANYACYREVRDWGKCNWSYMGGT